MMESRVGDLRVEESELEVLCTDSTAILSTQLYCSIY
jgi:hypothetical protein